MLRLEIHKFGGTSVAGAERMFSVAGLMEEAGTSARVVVVASAMAGVTDTLVALGTAAARGDRAAGLELARKLRAQHLNTLAQLGSAGALEIDAQSAGPGAIVKRAGEDARPYHRVGEARVEADNPEEETRRLTSKTDGLAGEIETLCGQLERILEAAVMLGELTPRANDRILSTGEKLSVRLLALALRRRGLDAVPVEADTFLETDDRFGEATPLAGVVDHTIEARLRPLIESGKVPVVTGFCGRAPDGSTTTLGRGGSDLSATLLAAALRADEVVIWTDVDGAFSADPRVVPEARLIRQLNYREATEMSYYGAKVLHQRTIIPVARQGIPVRICNSIRPSSSCTVIDRSFTPGSHPVKAISAIRGQALISVEGKGMAGVPGVAARVFRALAQRKISVTIISQSSSESSICFAVPGTDALAAEMALKHEFRIDISHGDVEEVVVRQKVGLVAAVGLGMAQTPGVSARVFTALGRRGINVLAIAQGSSELNISLAVDESQIHEAIRAIHAAFGLHRTDTGVDTAQGFDILLLGCGQIGRKLIELIRKRRAHIRKRFGLEARIVGIADRSGYLFVPSGLSQEALTEAVAAKAAGRPLSSCPGATEAKDPAALVRDATTYRLARPVLVDISDCATSDEVFREAFRHGCDVVTANKIPLAGPLETFQSLMSDAGAAGRVLKAEATVGAGLPVVDTLEMLLATGDQLTQSEGCLSGTLGFLMGRLEDGIPFSRAVAEAVEAGFTEPDPVADLSGADVARKATILGRISGLLQSDVPVRLEGLVDSSLAGMAMKDLMQAIEAYDAPFAERIRAAGEQGKVLRYVARVARGSAEVGVMAVPRDSSIGALKGPDNLVVFESERYSPRPLVVIGPGAGVEVTAMGVLGDILRIAAERKLP